MFANLVEETSTSTGTGDFTLGGAVTGRRTFNSQFGTGSGSLFRYVIDDGAGNFEIGETYLSDSTTLVRGGNQTVIDSSNGGSPVNFGSGEKAVYNDAAAADVLAEATKDHGTVSSGILTLDARFGWHAWTVGGDHFVEVSDWPAGARALRLEITDAASYSLTWPSALKWDGGSPPAWSEPTEQYPDATTLSFATLYSTSSQGSSLRGNAFSPNGTKYFACHDGSQTVDQYSCSTAGSINGASFDSVTLSFGSEDGVGYGIDMSPDGRKLVLAGFNNTAIFQYDCPEPGTINNASYEGVFLPIDPVSGLKSVRFSPSGEKLFVVGNSEIVQYTCSTPGRIDGAQYDNVLLDVSSQASAAKGLSMSPGGERIYVVDSGSAIVYEYECPIPGTIEQAVYTGSSYNVSGNVSSPYDVALGQDGARFVFPNYSNTTSYEYTASLVGGGTARKDVIEAVSPDNGATIYARRIWAEV